MVFSYLKATVMPARGDISRKNQGYPVNKTPSIGAIAWFDKNAYQSNAAYGHEHG